MPFTADSAAHQIQVIIPNIVFKNITVHSQIFK
jgi:hypothetical protein